MGTYVCMYVHMHIQLCLLAHHGFWLTDETTTTHGCDKGQEPEPFQTFFNSETHRPCSSEGKALGPVFFQKGKTQSTPIRDSFFFHKKNYFSLFLSPGRQPKQAEGGT